LENTLTVIINLLFVTQKTRGISGRNGGLLRGGCMIHAFPIANVPVGVARPQTSLVLNLKQFEGAITHISGID
jgi:hypothetical protein